MTDSGANIVTMERYLLTVCAFWMGFYGGGLCRKDVILLYFRMMSHTGRWKNA
jgi:hypothetical protein